MTSLVSPEYDLEKFYNHIQGDYLPPASIGKLADIDPALIVKPPKGLEAGYVPIASRQELERR